MFRPFSGAFLDCESPVELDGEYCSHSCFYCYSNINKPNRKADITGIIRQISTLHESNSTEAVLIKQGYPVLISNHVDPLSRSNDFMPAVIQSMYDSGYKIVIQSKLADDISPVYSKDHKILWAVTLETDREEWSKKIAPGAPSISKRISHIEKLAKSGHMVVILMAPYVPEWFDDIAAFVKLLKSIGVNSVWGEPLRFSPKGYEKNVKKKNFLTNEQLQDAYTSKPGISCLVSACKSAKMPFFSSYYGVEGKFMSGIDKLYPVRMPTMQEYLSGKKEFDIVEFGEFMEYARPMLPKGVFNLRDYIVQNDKDANVKNFKIPNNLTFEELIKIFWGDAKHIGKKEYVSRFSMASKFAFLAPVFKDGKAAHVDNKPIYCINHDLYDAIDI